MPAATRQPKLPNFDRVARFYRWAEYLSLGPLLQRTRNAHLDRLRHCRWALLFGDGDGRFLARLLAGNHALHATAVDTSSAMLGLLHRRCERALPAAGARLTMVCASALDVSVPPGVDLVVTHFFLDCLAQDEVDRLVRQTAASLQPGALWLVSDFALPATPVLRALARMYIRGLYLAFRLLTGLRVQALPDPQRALTRSGFRLVARTSRLFGLLYSELWLYAQNDPAQPARQGRSSTWDMATSTPADRSDPQHLPDDAQPDPEPAVPSLPEPDPGVFHHDPGTPHDQQK